MLQSRFYGIMGLLFSLVLLSGCGGRQFPSIKMRSAAQIPANFSETKEGVTVRVTWFDTLKKGRRLLGDMADKIMCGDRATYPVYISVVNQSSSSWVLRPGSIGLKFVEPDVIRKRLHESSWGRFFAILGMGVAAAATLGAAGVSLIQERDSGSQAVGCGLLALGEASLYATAGIATIEAVDSSARNNQVQQEIEHKVFDDAIVIHPGYAYQTIFFCPQKNFTQDFTVSLLKEGRPADMVTYSIDLQPDTFESHYVSVAPVYEPVYRTSSTETVVTVERTVIVR